MIDLIKSNFIAPTLTRVGTFAAGWLVAIGMTDGHANAVALGGVALATYAVDLVTAWARKRYIIDKTYSATVEGILTGAGLRTSPVANADGHDHGN